MKNVGLDFDKIRDLKDENNVAFDRYFMKSEDWDKHHSTLMAEMKRMLKQLFLARPADPNMQTSGTQRYTGPRLAYPRTTTPNLHSEDVNVSTKLLTIAKSRHGLN
jgi:hypothetical protein